MDQGHAPRTGEGGALSRPRPEGAFSLSAEEGLPPPPREEGGAFRLPNFAHLRLPALTPCIPAWRNNETGAPTMNNKHLADLERQDVEHALRQGLSLKQIAAKIGKHHSTLSREILARRTDRERVRHVRKTGLHRPAHPHALVRPLSPAIPASTPPPRPKPPPSTELFGPTQRAPGAFTPPTARRRCPLIPDSGPVRSRR